MHEEEAAKNKTRKEIRLVQFQPVQQASQQRRKIESEEKEKEKEKKERKRKGSEKRKKETVGFLRPKEKSEKRKKIKREEKKQKKKNKKENAETIVSWEDDKCGSLSFYCVLHKNHA